MKLKTLLLINAILTAVYATMLLLIPEKFFEMRGMNTNEFGLFITRLLGGPSQIGYALLSFYASRSASSDVIRLVSRISFVTWTLGLAVFLFGKLTLSMSNMVWGDIFMAAIFALAFGYFSFIKTTD